MMMQQIRQWRYPADGRRDLRLDFLRGYAVFAMISDHVAGISWFSPFTGGNRFVTSAAEGFVLLAGLVLGMVYGPRIARDGWLAAADPILRRAAVLYGVTVGLTLIFVALFQFTELRLWLDRTYGLGLADPVELVVGTLTLHFVYHGTDILLLYCVLIAVSPLLLLFLSRGRWPLVLAGSWFIWLAHQFYPAQVAIPWTVTNAYYFPVAGWQVIFVSALIVGYYREQAARFLSRVPVGAWLGLFSVGLAVLIVIQRAHDTGRLASWPVLGPLAGDLYYQVFDKPSVAIGRLVASAIVAGFTYALVTVCWVPLRTALGWFVMPLGFSSLRAYGMHLLVIVAVYNVEPLADLYDRSRTGNTVLQIVTVGLTFLLIVGWKRLEEGIGVDVGAGMLPSLLAHQRRQVLIGAASGLLLVVAATTVLVAGPVRASRSADPTDLTVDAGLLRYIPQDAPPDRPLTVLLVLHDADTTGPEAARSLLVPASQNGWAVIAPTLAYGEWSDPEQVVGEMLVQLPLLRELVQPGEAWEDRPIGERVLVLGEGRGAHTAVAFALFYPESTSAIATVGPAPCVVPSTAQLATPDAPPLPFPYGVDDLELYVGDELETEELREVAVWMGLVPDDDVVANSCPWGALAGRAPSERADLFLTLLRRAGARVEGAEYPEPGSSGRAREEAVKSLTRTRTTASP
ncbi:MAG TPA: OpgC domain-containing protein [Chloroflexota bacterium]|nr:OpgC domain-containing protein [Chloroflexota bacterium]